MAIYQFSALADGQAISFDASADRLNFDQTAVAAGDLSLSMEGSSLRVTVKSGAQSGKDVLLLGTSLEQLASGVNMTFADGSVVRIGDNTTGTANDAAGNVLAGGAGRDLLMGLGGNDNLQAGDNNDSLVGGTGNDTVSGNNGNDWMDGGAGNDTLNGGGGQDTFILSATGTGNADLLGDFASGWDRIELDAAALTAIGATGRFASGDVRFFAGTAAHDADDRIIYNAATGQIWYDADGNGAGAAQLIATLPSGRGVTATDFNVIGTAPSGGNTINGTAGDDTLIGTPGDDTINGLGGNDSLVGQEGADALNGGDGNDTLDAWSSGTGDLAADTLSGGLGNDVYRVHDDGDVILADAGGIDTVQALNVGSWTLAADLENLDLEDSRGIAADGTGNALNNVIRSATEGGTLSGLGGNDLLIARHAQNTLQMLGGDGNDTLDGSGWHTDMDGGTGDDVLIGSLANANSDMTGGAGSDTFVFQSSGFGSLNTLADFSSGADRLRFDGNAFTQIGASGNFAAGDARFHAAAGANAGHDADDRIVYNTTTGQLWYDADGSGSGAAELIGILQGAPTLLATDITVVNGTAGGGSTITGTAANDTLVGTAGDDTISGLGGNDSLFGGDGADSIVGGDGNDTLDAGNSRDPDDGTTETDADTLAGGNGDDLYIVHANTVILADPQGDDWVWAERTDWTLGAGQNNLRLIATADFDGQNGTGNELNNIIDPSGVDHGGTYHGLGGNDTIFSAQHGGLYFGDDGNDTFRIESQTSPGTFNGGSGDDTFISGFSTGTLIGGVGTDTFTFLDPTNGGTITDFASGVEKIHLDATTMDALGASGNFAAGDVRFFVGAAAHDADDRVIFDSSTGNLFYDADGNGSASAQLIVNVQTTVQATDIVVDNGTAGGEGQTINGTAGDDSLLGGAGTDTINGFAGNDTIDGAGGRDSMVGGSGDDLYFVDDSSDITIELENEGIDEVRSSADSYRIWDWVNNLTLTGSAEHGFGNAIDNLIVGNNMDNGLVGEGGNDTLNGGGGFDRLEGGAGADHYVFSGAGTATADAVFGFETGVDKLHLDATAMTTLGASGNFVAGDARFFTGSAAHDADDRIIWDGVNLWYDADGVGAAAQQKITEIADFSTGVVATDIVVDNGTAAGGQVINGTSGNDSLVGGTGNDTINGNAGNDTLRGGAGDDSLTGGSGLDSMDGGLGNDIFVVFDTDTLVDAGGTDLVFSSISWALSSAFENLTFTGTGNVDGSGNFFANAIVGNGGNNVLRGRDGHDTLTGGGGSDFFDFVTAPSAANSDVITDFTSGVDRLRLDDGAHAGIGATGSWAASDGRFFAAAGATAGHDANDRVVYDTSTGAVYYDADGSGSGAAVLVATLTGAPTLAASDISVI